MVLTFNGEEVSIRNFDCKSIHLRGFEFEGGMWLLLDEVVSNLKVSTEEVKALLEEEPEDFGTLSDGRPVIKEGGFNYLALYASDTPEAKEYQEWVFGSVVPSIMEKGYYSIDEENGGGKDERA
ncbi:MAG: hypothetical protein IJS28_07145 [Synergistaceae bacterium]|nr:hypothetical protein [Synergistaceae bacterium]